MFSGYSEFKVQENNPLFCKNKLLQMSQQHIPLVKIEMDDIQDESKVYNPVKEECEKYVVTREEDIKDEVEEVKDEYCYKKSSLKDHEPQKCNSGILLAMDLLKKGNMTSYPGVIFKCSECGYIPEKQTKKDIKLHMAMHRDSFGLKRPFTKSETVNLTCCHCDKMFKAFSDLQRHLVQHTGERTWQCEVCSKSFGLKYHLTRHMATHSDSRQQVLHMCNICGKEFTSSRSRNVHELSHSGQFLYNCEHCGKGFNEKSILKKHTVKRHGGSYSNFCDMCGKGFMTSRALNTHTPNCGLIKPKKKKENTSAYPCIICNKIFNRKCNLERHIKSHNEEKDHSCDQCGKQFKDYRSVKSHRKKKHESGNTYGLEDGILDTAETDRQLLASFIEQK